VVWLRKLKNVHMAANNEKSSISIEDISIPDEDIEDVAWEKFVTDSARLGFIEGAKWAIKYLKTNHG